MKKIAIEFNIHFKGNNYEEGTPIEKTFKGLKEITPEELEVLKPFILAYNHLLNGEIPDNLADLADDVFDLYDVFSLGYYSDVDNISCCLEIDESMLDSPVGLLLEELIDDSLSSFEMTVGEVIAKIISRNHINETEEAEYIVLGEHLWELFSMPENYQYNKDLDTFDVSSIGEESTTKGFIKFISVEENHPDLNTLVFD